MSNCTDISRFAKCGEEGVLALLSDSTNAEKDGYTESDQIVKESLQRSLQGVKAG